MGNKQAEIYTQLPCLHCRYYTFFPNRQINGVNPEKWLNKVLDAMADYPCNTLQNLYPGTLEVQLLGGVRCFILGETCDLINTFSLSSHAEFFRW